MNIRIVSMARAASVAGAALICGSTALAATPANMKAIVQKGTGGPEVLSVQTVPVRDPGDGQVLIKVYAASVNPVDWKMRTGMGNRGGGGPPGGAPGVAPAGGPGGPPGAGGPAGGPPGGAMAASTDRIPGVDVAGVVEKVGPGVTSVKVGDSVFSMVGRAVQGLNGAYAEYALAPATNVIAKPKNLTYGQAAGLGTASMTGYRVVAQTNVAKGQRVLITGVAGGVGSAAAQIAKARGAYVIGTASARHNAYLKSIGVDQVVDYTKGNFEDQVKDVDVVIDTVGGDTSERSIKTLKKGGTFSSVAGRVADDKCAAAGITCQGNGPPGTSSGMNEGDMLSAVGKLAEEGKLKVNVDKSFPLDKAADAQVYGADGHTEGKIVLDVNAQANKK